MKKHGLGRGLDAFFPAGVVGEGLLAEISIHAIQPNPYQPRHQFDDEALDDLIDSVRQHGILQPIVLRRQDNGYQIIAGERRWRAAGKAGLTIVPAVIRECDERAMMELALIENIQRQNLNPIEEAEAYRRLMGDFGLTQEEMAKRMGRSRSHIANILRLLSLAVEIQEMIIDGRLTSGQARPLVTVESPDEQIRIAGRVLKDGLNARDVEMLVRKQGRVRVDRRLSKETYPHLQAAEDHIAELFGTKVRIKTGKVRSRIEIEYYNEDDLMRIMDLLAQLEMKNGEYRPFEGGQMVV